jgi:8-oxo-dGTP pyrophosphatase MutT (NUDIX family)
MPSAVDVDSWLKIQTWPDLRELVTETPTTPYVHPYGFVVFRIEAGWFPEWHIRVHLWPTRVEMLRRIQENGVADQLVHCHGWDMKSIVCLGSLSEHRYKLRTGHNCTKRLYHVVSDYAAGKSTLFAAEPDLVEPILVADTEREALAGIYYIRAGEFHSTITSKGPAVSVVATSRTQIGSSQVVGPPIKDGETANIRRSVKHVDFLLDSYDKLYLESTTGADRWASFVFLVDKYHRVLVVRPTRRPELWQPIGGRSEQVDRDPMATVIREAGEEIGVHLDPSQLIELGIAERDVGKGKVHFWVMCLESALPIDTATSEIFDWDWIPLGSLADLPMYAGTRSALERLRRYVESCDQS